MTNKTCQTNIVPARKSDGFRRLGHGLTWTQLTWAQLPQVRQKQSMGVVGSNQATPAIVLSPTE
eukprot:m.95130 g.95130  ORF g.95130 m.95130 type:complete len:64 (-) comp15142_c0_seq4:556-747(-)